MVTVAFALGWLALAALLLLRLRATLDQWESRLRLGSKLLDAGIAERERLEQEIVTIEERERRQIGSDLLGGLEGPLGEAVSLGRALQEKLAGRDAHREAAEAQQIVALVEEAFVVTRNIAIGAPHGALQAGDLAVALQRLATRTATQFFLPCEFHAESSTPIGDPFAAAHLYRIAQESISNAIRHGDASRVEIVLRQDLRSRRLTLMIRDDGMGLARGDAGQLRGLGLRIMAYRANMIGATLDISPAEDRGTVVSCGVPVSW